MKKEMYIIRGNRSGVFFGEIKERKENPQNVVLGKVRRLWSWAGAASISQLALEGVKAPESCHFTVVVDEIELTDVIELVKCTKEAIDNINGVKVWKRL